MCESSISIFTLIYVGKCTAAPPLPRMPTSDCKYLRMLSKWESRYNTVRIIYYSFNVIFLVTRIHRQGCPGRLQRQLKLNAIYIFFYFPASFLRPPVAVNNVPSTSIVDFMASKVSAHHEKRFFLLRRKVNDQAIPLAADPKPSFLFLIQK